MISPASGVALYRQVAERLRADIAAGKIRPGQPLPSERTLQQEFGVARETVRHAIRVLRTEGLVVVDRGHGVVVRGEPELEQLTLPAGATVRIRMPTQEERARLDLTDWVPVFEVTDPAGAVQVYAGDAWYLRCPPD